MALRTPADRSHRREVRSSGLAVTSGTLEEWISQLCARGGRRLLGIVGAPGSGKSTLAVRLAATMPDQAVVVPMDGFHLAQPELERLGRADRKGAPDTFDPAGFIALLVRLRRPTAGETVYAPAFNREIEESIAGTIAVPPGVPLVIVEGNYLLLGDVWAGVSGLLDESWYLDTPELLRRTWLRERHMRFGRGVGAADAWIDATDMPNASLIEATRERATRLLSWPLDVDSAS
ncbi:nucleoside/nucleotide kinase family protein [Sphingomonas bacterium]|uniref:nucleoside/nucleotide kinase family protein n=1 Tax=Sphingomonas bacterium TaxID=1895847 RepID=UPI0015772816|nr:nucleoside/nucleotide kinase family protein [Sphingomonas bacterium]